MSSLPVDHGEIMVHIDSVVTVRDVVALRILQDEKSRKKSYYYNFRPFYMSNTSSWKIAVPSERDTELKNAC